MKMKKRIMGILLSIALVMGLIPSMSLTAYAEENHQIHNTISDIISLSITKNGTPVTEANSGDTITLTVNGSPTTGSNSTFLRFDRNIMIDGLAVSDTGGNEVSLQSAGSLSWTFTMPNSDVYITFPLLTAGSSIPVGAGQAVFRSGKSNGSGYSFIANKQGGSSYEDTVGYLAYIQGGGNYKFAVDDDSGRNDNSSYNFRIPSSGQVSIDNGTYFHIGFALFSNDNSGTFSPSGNTGDITISFIAVQKTRQIISANNLTISVNDMDKKVNASITNGDGTLSYTVLEGTDVITVNRNTGAITPLKTGTARIEIEASETDTFQRTTSTITVTVEKARAVAATVAANNRTYDGTEKPLVTISGEPTGGTMYYALGEDTTTAPDDNLFTTSIPAKTDVGIYYVWYKVVGDGNHADSEEVNCIEVTIGEAMLMQVDFIILRYNGTRGLPEEIDGLPIKPVIHVKDGDSESVSKGLELELKKGMESKVSVENVVFTGKVTDPAPGKYEVTVTGLPKSIYGSDKIYSSEGPVEGPVKWKYELIARGEINEKDKKIVVTIYLIFDDGSRPEVLKVYALPEDEIGAYKLKSDGTKEYLLFHTYDICMQWLGRDELCRGYERCFHKESPFVNPFVKP